MLQHKLSSCGHYLLKKPTRLTFLPCRLLSHDQPESPTFPHNANPLPPLPLTDKLPSSCHVLIAGGGIIGQSVAYHLSEIGVRDIVLVEKAK